MNEKEVEKYLDIQIKQQGGFTRKWASPGRVGVPDRICFLPGGVIYFVEVKTDTGALSVRQGREIAQLIGIGCRAQVVYGAEGVDVFINTVRYET